MLLLKKQNLAGFIKVESLAFIVTDFIVFSGAVSARPDTVELHFNDKK